MPVNKLKYIPHDEINKRKWDYCISHAFNGIIYGYSWYLDIVSPGWEALVTEDYKAIMPLTNKKRFTINYLCQPKFTQQLGVFSIKDLSVNEVNNFLNAIPDKFKLIEINLNTSNTSQQTSFQYKENITCHLDLNNTYEAIAKGYSQQIKRNIKKGEKNNIAIEESTDIEIVIELFKANRGKDISTLQEEDYNILKQIMNHCLTRKKVQVWVAKDKDGNIIAGAFFIESNGKAIFLFSGVNEVARETGAMSFLIDTFIKSNADKPLILDFEGSNDKQLARFYKSFGAVPVEYLSIKRNNLPKVIKWLK